MIFDVFLKTSTSKIPIRSTKSIWHYQKYWIYKVFLYMLLFKCN